MPIIDFSKTTFQLIAGDGDDVTDFVDSIKIGVPDPDPGQILTWQGSISLSQNLAARLKPSNYFEAKANPLRWRPDRPFLLKIFSGGKEGLIPLRVQKYSFNRATKKAEVNVVQIIDSIAKDRPAESPEIKIDRKRGTELKDLIKALIGMGYKAIDLPTPPIDTGLIWGKIEDDTATRNPINTAADLASSCWVYMRVLANESISFRSLDPLAYPVVFRRPFGSIDIEPDMGVDVDWKSKAIVTGHYQKADESECGNRSTSGATFVDKKGLDNKGRAVIQTTSGEEYLSLLTVNGDPQPPVLTKGWTKTILTQYEDAVNPYRLIDLWTQVSDGLSTALNGDPVVTPNPSIVADEIPELKRVSSCATGVLGTITVQCAPFEVIFSDVPAGADRGKLFVKEVEIQTELKKVTFKPRGVASPASVGSVLDLVITRREVVEPNSASKRGMVEDGARDPNDPSKGTRCLEKEACPEDKQEAPEFKMTTVPVRGECSIAPQNWEPLVKLPLVEDFGFIPSQEHGDKLACQVAAKHVRKQEAFICEMPIAPEWLESGCPPNFRFHYDDAEYEAIAPAIEITDKGGKFNFDALRIGEAPIVPQAPLPSIPQFNEGFAIVAPDAIELFYGDTIDIPALFAGVF